MILGSHEATTVNRFVARDGRAATKLVNVVAHNHVHVAAWCLTDDSRASLGGAVETMFAACVVVHKSELFETVFLTLSQTSLALGLFGQARFAVAEFRLSVCFVHKLVGYVTSRLQGDGAPSHTSTTRPYVNHYAGAWFKVKGKLHGRFFFPKSKVATK